MKYYTAIGTALNGRSYHKRLKRKMQYDTAWEEAKQAIRKHFTEELPWPDRTHAYSWGIVESPDYRKLKKHI